METRDPSAPGFGLPLHTDGAQQDDRSLILHPRAAAWLWVTPIVLCGLILSSCNFFFFLTPAQADSQGREYFVAFGLMGLVILAAPLLNFFNAEVRFSTGVVTKRGLLRRVQRWEPGQLVRIRSYVRYIGGFQEWDFLNYTVYRFLASDGGIAFDLTQAWWKTSDIEALAEALHLYAPAPSET